MSLLNNKIEMGAVSLRVKDLRSTQKFYTDVMGLDVLEESEFSISLGIENRVFVNLEFDREYQPFSTRETGLYHMAFLLPSENDLTAFLFHTSAIKFELDGAADHAFSQALYLHDNEGNGIEVYADREVKQWPSLDRGISDPLDVDGLVDRYDGEPWTKMPRGSRMGHVHLQVKDLGKASLFYSDFLGMDIVMKMSSALFMSKNGYHHHLGMNTWQHAIPSSLGGLISYEIVVDNLDAILKFLHSQTEYEFKVSDKGVLIHDGQGIWTHLVRSGF